MTLESDIETLKKVAFFAEFGADPLRLIAFSAEAREFADRAVLFDEGEPADSGFVVVQGRIDLMRQEGRGQRLLASLGPCNLIGELALIVDTVRPAKALSIGRSRVLTIRRSVFRRVLDEYPAIAEDLTARITARLTGLVPEIDRIEADLATDS
ncbi:MAG: cyclic nucleotide-binding domain-containing protein [Ancalomicrobiaceae bacterium]|nr:cyclic nucleotide-binding domain-containing protein [Ancalomicrobiaceae bacterium]